MRNRFFFGLIASTLFWCMTAGPAFAQKKAVDYHNPAVPGPDVAAFWIDQGGLFATYGNYTAAVRAYKKALTLNPNSHAAQFDLGLAYAQMEDFDAALEHINKAIELAPDQDGYYYGRGWALLLAGRKELAQKDIQKAAGMGNKDARAYLQRP